MVLPSIVLDRKDGIVRVTLLPHTQDVTQPLQPVGCEVPGEAVVSH
jgi:hypothetical protein